MLNIAISTTETIIMSIATIIWAAFLYGGFAFGKIDTQEKGRIPLWTRLASSFTLVVAAWLWFSITQGTSIGQLSTWLAIGMSLSFIGDIFMANILPIEPYIIYGIAAFGIGHIAYILGFTNMGLQFNDSNFPNYAVLIFWWIIAVLGWFLLVFWKSERNYISYAALPYALLLATTVGMATSLALNNQEFTLIAIGAGLFLLSDLVLAAELFSNLHFRLIGDFIWLSYGTGQTLIVCGLLLYITTKTLVVNT